MRTRCAQTCMFLIPFQRTLFGSRPERNSKTYGNTISILRFADLASPVWVYIGCCDCSTTPDVDVDVGFEFRWGRCRDSSLLSGSETCLSERSEFACFPLSSELSREPEGQRLRSPFSCLLLFGEAKRSERPPGRPRRGDRSKN